MVLGIGPLGGILEQFQSQIMLYWPVTIVVDLETYYHVTHEDQYCDILYKEGVFDNEPRCLGLPDG